MDGDGQRVADGTVQLRQVPEQEAPPDPAAVDTTTDANGRFSFAGLGQGQYVVDLLIDGQVVATGGPFSLAEGGMLFVEVGGAASQPATDKGGMHPALGLAVWYGTVFLVASVLFVVVFAAGGP